MTEELPKITFEQLLEEIKDQDPIHVSPHLTLNREGVLHFEKVSFIEE
jgi:hypothetical protein